MNWINYNDRLMEYERIKIELRALGIKDEELIKVWDACANKATSSTYTLLELLNLYKYDIMKYGEPNLSQFIFND